MGAALGSAPGRPSVVFVASSVSSIISSIIALIIASCIDPELAGTLGRR